MTNEILDDLIWRYTTKVEYDTNKQISKEDLETIKEALRLSASSINSQPWRFIILQTNEAKERFVKTFESSFEVNRSLAQSAPLVILFANKTHYDESDYKKVVDCEIKAGRILPKNADKALAKSSFAKLNADENGYNGHWTKAQTYIALGNILHVLSRLKIYSTPMEGIDASKINDEFKKELKSGYECSFALTLGYKGKGDFNRDLKKARLSHEEIFETI